MHKVDICCLDGELTSTPSLSVYYGLTEEDKDIVCLVVGEVSYTHPQYERMMRLGY